MEQMPQKLVSTLRQEGFASLGDLTKALKYNNGQYTQEEQKTIRSLLDLAKTQDGLTVPDVERWYVSRGEIQYKHDDPFATNDLRSLYHGTLYTGTKVAVRVVNAESSEKNVRKQFVNEVRRWFMLRTPHILPLYGANDLGKPLILVCAMAELGNYNEYLKQHPDRLWRLFLDAARGLEYMHKFNIVHGNLKCSNLLVRAQGMGVVSDFGFALCGTTVG